VVVVRRRGDSAVHERVGSMELLESFLFVDVGEARAACGALVAVVVLRGGRGRRERPRPRPRFYFM